MGTICFIVGTTSPSILVNEPMDSLALWSSEEYFCMASAKGRSGWTVVLSLSSYC